MKYLIYSFCLLFVIKLNAQKLELPFKFGEVSTKEIKLKYYDKDSTASAVVLYEKGHYKMKPEKKQNFLLATYYYKIKIFKKKSYNQATISIPLFNTHDKKEVVFNIKGITHNFENNKIVSHILKDENIFRTKISDNWDEVKFTLPNVKEGSVIEYTYSVKTPFWKNFDGWTFQGLIPKIYSEIHTQIPLNWIYRRTVKGYKKLDKREEVINKKCFSVKNISTSINNCQDGIYVMKDIPAFKEEIYLTSVYDFLYKIDFKLVAYLNYSNGFETYLSSWDNFDYFFKTDDELGKQLKKIKYTKRLLPDYLFKEKDSLVKAKNIYYYIQNYFSKKDAEQIFKDLDFKKAFKTKVGTATEINLALCNALKAAGLSSSYMLISTRSNGIPTLEHPVMTDYNYAICALKINKRLYYLDASIKLMPFGILPFETLNTMGRILDMEHGSYWRKVMGERNVQIKNINLKLNDKTFTGVMRIVNNAYAAFIIRDFIKNSSKDDYKEFFEANSGMSDLKIESLRLKNLAVTEKPLIEDFKLSFDLNSDDGNLIVINPYFDKIKTNPFSLKERTYPVDFGYPETEKYRFTLTIPKGYTINSLPKELNVKMENNAANISSKVNIFNNSITIDYKININKTVFLPEEYQKLKTFYKSVIDLQNDIIVLKKKL
jgi:Domain of Unknown Function with PDB structure (DUF3858)